MYKGTLSDPAPKSYSSYYRKLIKLQALPGRIPKPTLVYRRFRNLPFTPGQCHSQACHYDPLPPQ